MNYIKIILKVLLFVFVIMYLLCSFCAWELNAGKWDGIERVSYVLISLFFSVVLSVFMIENYEKSSYKNR